MFPEAGDYNAMEEDGTILHDGKQDMLNFISPRR
jgi:hypothetical protein